MEREKHTYKANKTFASFEFESMGPKGVIKKLIEYKKIDLLDDGTPVFNLSFGDQRIMLYS